MEAFFFAAAVVAVDCLKRCYRPLNDEDLFILCHVPVLPRKRRQKKTVPVGGMNIKIPRENNHILKTKHNAWVSNIYVGVIYQGIQDTPIVNGYVVLPTSGMCHSEVAGYLTPGMGSCHPFFVCG